MDQNKQLCKAAKLRHVGNKPDLIKRLLEEPQTEKYACEMKYIGTNVEQIKAMCREKNLQVTGTKFDLVLRILHCDNDSTPEGMTLKRAATDVVTTTNAAGEVVQKHVPKKRKKAAPSASKVYTRVQKKIEAVNQKKYQSHWGSKCHSTDVYDLVGSILYNDIERSEEDYLKKDPRFALGIAEAACTSLIDNFDTMCRPGYDDAGGWSTIDDSLSTIVKAAKPILSAEEREETAEWIEAMYNTANAYSLCDGTDILSTVESLRGTDDGKKSEETEVEVDDRKPAAVASTVAAAVGALPQKKAEEATVNNDSNVVKENFVNSDSIDAVEPSRE